ncbi:MAG: MoaD/ThiS family protein [Ilumatobacteraceae bacterium]
MAQLLLFASAREAAGRSRDTVSGATVADVLAVAKGRFGPSFESVLASCTIWLNGEECDPHTPVSESDEVAVLPPVSGGAKELSDMTLDELRSQRGAMQTEEDSVSFVRRIVQGRLDIARDEIRRRASGEAPQRDVTGGITRVFANERGSGSTRPPRDTEIAADHQLMGDLEKLCDSVGFGALRDLDDGELDACVQRLAEFESVVSARRKDLFSQIDALSTELVRRYKTSTSSVDALLDESR